MSTDFPQYFIVDEKLYRIYEYKNNTLSGFWADGQWNADTLRYENIVECGTPIASKYINKLNKNNPEGLYIFLESLYYEINQKYYKKTTHRGKNIFYELVSEDSWVKSDINLYDIIRFAKTTSSINVNNINLAEESNKEEDTVNIKNNVNSVVESNKDEATNITNDITNSNQLPSKAKEKECTIIKCPTCGSTRIEKITGTKKLGAALLIGVFAIPYAGKSFKCHNCGYKW